ncbi:exopolysaccharide biosynthesis polyprenyl glycosylphosphotransferase [Propionigenium maris]|uniref:exopolysaccharide biosynthesis polyprenyl glycosylphosphotransferase n=1 Tax=Propionigenium maris TaxID=45622 RepID=UPI0024939E16|nr:exopolysaccharide biosynthesis polyprenyl glycosylphosphotransferase [Propionigenium maris]
MIRGGNIYYGTPMKSYSYIIFLLIYLYYYLFDILNFTDEYGRWTPWVRSSAVNIVISVMLWSFSKSYLVFFKFFLLWVGSNLLRMVMVKVYRKDGTYRGLYIGKAEDYITVNKGFAERNFGQLEYISIDKVKSFKEVEELLRERNLDLISVEEEFMRKYEVEFLKLKIKGYKVYCEWQLMQEIERKIYVEKIKEKWFLYSEGFEILHNTFQKNLKKIFDISMATIIGILTLPVMGLTFLIVKLDGGPALFRQKRVGLRGEEFEIIKFRSMSVDAEKHGAQWAQKNDSRITKVGKFIRKTRIDELPQLWNVVRGEMSFVGPRPERLVFIEKLEKEIPFYDVRHSIKPGLTGWAQVMYPYGSSVEDALHKLEYDLYYLKHQNFMFDLMVFFKTIKVVLSRRGV